MTALERAARAVWDEIARQNGENTSGYAGTFGGRANYVEGFIDTASLARAVLMAVRDFDGDVYVGPNLIEDHECGPIFASVIDAILNEKDTTND